MTDIAVMCTWALVSSHRKLSGVVAAGDTDQAARIRKAIDKLVRCNAWLNEFLDVQRRVVLNKDSGSELEILSSDAPTSYGLEPDFIICDELTHWASEELWSSLFSSAAKVDHCLLVVIANAGFTSSWQWPLREAIRTDPDWHFHRLDSPQASWINEQRLAEQRRLLPAISFDRLWLNKWSSGSGDALSEADINAAITTNAPPPQAEPGWRYFGALDLGLKRDASAFAIVGQHVGYTERKPLPPRRRPQGALAAMADLGLVDSADEPEQEYVVHEGTGRLRVVDVRVWRPADAKVDLAQIEREILTAHRQFNFGCVGADPWQAAYLIERLRKQSVPVDSVDFVPANLKSMATATMEAFSERQIDLLDHADLLTDLRNLRVVEKGYGVRLESPRGPSGHGDAATALSIALHVIAKWGNAPTPQASAGRELVCFP